MNAALPNAFRATHSIASTIHAALSAAGMTSTDLAIAVVESERFINAVLQGEDGLDRLINVAFLQKIADATGKTLVFKIPPQKSGNRSATVKSGKGSPT